MEKRPMVTVVLLTRNGGDDLKKVLGALKEQKTDFEFEVLVFDNESTDGSWEAVQAYPGARCIKLPRREFLHGPTRNKAMEAAKGEIVVFLVQDAIPVGTKWLKTLVGPLQTKNQSLKTAGVTGRQMPPLGIPISQKFFLLNSYTDKPKVIDELPKDFGPGRVWFSNVDSAISKKVWRKIHFSNVVMSEDQAWAREVIGAGYRIVYEPKAQVIHNNQMSIGKIFKRNVDSGASFASLKTSVPSIGSGRIWRWLFDELKFAWGENGVSGVCYVAVYEGARWIGFQTGYRNFVPWQVKKFFSIVPQWWDIEMKSRMKVEKNGQ